MGAEATHRVVDLVCEDVRWQDADIAGLAERAARAALTGAGLAPEAFEVALLAADDARIAALNLEYRGRQGPTNVLSWPALEADRPGAVVAEPDQGPVFLGDLALAYETCTREAEERGIAPADHAMHLVVHGVLHLLRYDHATDAQAEAMEELERKILASIGVADPYGA